jgi:hypothetical protein
MSCVAYHEQRAAIRRIHFARAAKARLFIGPYRARIGWIGIDHEARYAIPQQSLNEDTNECRSVAARNHIGIADELIDPAGAGRLRTKAAMPFAYIVALQIG